MPSFHPARNKDRQRVINCISAFQRVLRASVRGILRLDLDSVRLRLSNSIVSLSDRPIFGLQESEPGTGDVERCVVWDERVTTSILVLLISDMIVRCNLENLTTFKRFRLEDAATYTFKQKLAKYVDNN